MVTRLRITVLEHGGTIEGEPQELVLDRRRFLKTHDRKDFFYEKPLPSVFCEGEPLTVVDYSSDVPSFVTVGFPEISARLKDQGSCLRDIQVLNRKGEIDNYIHGGAGKPYLLMDIRRTGGLRAVYQHIPARQGVGFDRERGSWIEIEVTHQRTRGRKPSQRK